MLWRNLVIGCLLVIAGCADPYAPITTSAGRLTQADADAIVQKCGGEAHMLTVEDGELIFVPAKDFDITSCVLRALRETGETGTEGVGNRRY